MDFKCSVDMDSQHQDRSIAQHHPLMVARPNDSSYLSRIKHNPYNNHSNNSTEHRKEIVQNFGGCRVTVMVNHVAIGPYLAKNWLNRMCEFEPFIFHGRY